MCFVPQQIYKFEALLPPVVKKKEKKPAEARPKKKPRVDTENNEEGAEVDDGRRKSKRISRKVCLCETRCQPIVTNSFQFQTSRFQATMSDDSADEDYEGEYEDEDTDEEEDGERRKRKRSSGPKQKIVVPRNRVNFYGAVPGVEVGRIWETRMGASFDGIQRPPVAGIHGGKTNSSNFKSQN